MQQEDRKCLLSASYIGPEITPMKSEISQHGNPWELHA